MIAIKNLPKKWLLVIPAALVVILGVVLACLPKQEATPPVQTTADTTPVLEENPFGYTDFQFDGDYLTCLAGESVLGIDVSSHQQEIDWQQVADAGIKFAMVRIGYRGYQTGLINLDEFAQANYEGAKAAGIQVGAYFFSQATSVEEAQAEAQALLEVVDSWELDMPVVYDWEYVKEEARTAETDARTVTDCAAAFCQTVEAAGYKSMVYFNPHHTRNHIYIEELAQYDFWLALYANRMNFPYKVDMWQYTNEGRVPGIRGDVDINLWFPYEN